MKGRKGVKKGRQGCACSSGAQVMLLLYKSQLGVVHWKEKMKGFCGLSCR